MTLRQLVRPIEVVSPEHSSDDRSHEFQIASQMNACIEFSKVEYARSHQSRIRTLHHFSSFIQICTKPEAFLAHQPKIQDFPHHQKKEDHPVMDKLSMADILCPDEMGMILQPTYKKSKAASKWPCPNRKSGSAWQSHFWQCGTLLFFAPTP